MIILYIDYFLHIKQNRVKVLNLICQAALSHSKQIFCLFLKHKNMKNTYLIFVQTIPLEYWDSLFVFLTLASFNVFAFPFIQFFWSMTTSIVVFVDVKVWPLVLGQVKYLNRSLSSPAKVEGSEVYAVRLQHTAHLQQ